MFNSFLALSFVIWNSSKDSEHSKVQLSETVVKKDCFLNHFKHEESLKCFTVSELSSDSRAKSILSTKTGNQLSFSEHLF